MNHLFCHAIAIGRLALPGRNFLFILALTLTACRPAPQTLSYSSEQIDTANNLLTRYGLKEMPLYGDLLASTEVSLKDEAGKPFYPWSDIYWPTSEKGLARRWDAVLSPTEKNQVNETDFFIASYFKTQIQAFKEAGDPSIYLAPAEKFDIVFRQLNGLSLPDTHTSLSRLGDIEALHDAEDIASHSAESWLSTNRKWAGQYLQGLAQSSSSGLLEQLSPLTTEGLRNWLTKSANPKNSFPGLDMIINWFWEGICHGWAPASFMSEEPKHAVRVAVDSPQGPKHIVFTEGDIRGLLSKIWAESKNKNQFFIGRRCSKNVDDPDRGIPANSQGRGISGSFLLLNEKGQSIETPFTLVQDYPRIPGSRSIMRIILEDSEQERKDTPRFAYLVSESADKSVNYSLYPDEASAFSAATSTRQNQVANVKDLAFYGCWDVNPASFHAVLVDSIGKKNLGFIMDRTRTGQVWNQPVSSASFKIGPLLAVSSADTNDRARHYRAPGTRYIAAVEALVKWTGEPNAAHFTYIDEDGKDLDHKQIKETKYSYSLEFDSEQRLIGGEWGTLDSFQATEVPDFLYGYDSKQEPELKHNLFMDRAYSTIIKKIHDCSLAKDIDGSIDARVPGPRKRIVTLAYTDCLIR